MTKDTWRGRQSSEPERRFYRAREIAEVMGISKAEVYRRIACGEIASVRLGRAICIPVEAMQEWIGRLRAFSMS